MCGIVGVVAQRNVVSVLLECLRRLEYRGYDSAGIAVFTDAHKLERVRVVGRVDRLAETLKTTVLAGNVGIAHTRWATHGAPTEANAHPHVSNGQIALIHNGIIENHESLRAELAALGYEFTTDTDTEVIAHAIYHACSLGADFLSAVHQAVQRLEGAYALAVINTHDPERIIAVRCGSPVVVGVGIGENFVASDPIALLPVTQQFIYLEEGDLACIERTQVSIYDAHLQPVQRALKLCESTYDAADRGNYRHYMQKEIFEQPMAAAETIEGRLNRDHVFVEAFGNRAQHVCSQVEHVQIVACGSSYHAGLVGRYWLESSAKIPTKVEVGSELRYRHTVVEPGTLLVTISQSGETADTLAALQQARNLPYISSLAICNVPESSIVRAADLVFMTRAGIEVGVATTKAFTTQLIGLLMLTMILAKRGNIDANSMLEAQVVQEIRHVPHLIEQVLALDPQIRDLAEQLVDQRSAFFLGRGVHYPIAMEGALKMKEIAYIHAEALPAGELKHGPLALVDRDMPVVVVAPNDQILEKLKSNLNEISARDGKLIIFTDEHSNISARPNWSVLRLPSLPAHISPIIYNIPLQLLAYHVAVLKGTDVDRPRHLAKSVTVE